jgi:hypothetical protein
LIELLALSVQRDNGAATVHADGFHGA